MNPNKALWEKGDFTLIAETMRQNGEELSMMLASPTISNVNSFLL